jgi:hypothetical protein
MPSSRTYILALTVTAVAAGLAMRRRATRDATAAEKTQLQTWENEGGSPVPPAAVVKPPA